MFSGPGSLLRLLACGFASLFILARPAGAEPRWIKARLGSFESVSDDGRRSATQALSQFAQFSFALGTVLGKPELKLDPPLRIIVYKTQKELDAQCGGTVRSGRDRLMVCTTAEGQLPRTLLRELTRLLLANNFAAMPAGMPYRSASDM